jgi:hypothetical protein
MVRLGTALGGLVTVIAEAVGTVKPVCDYELSQERSFRAGVNWHIRAAQFHGKQSIARCLCDGDVAGHDSDGSHLNVSRAQRHNDRNGIVGSCVRVNQKGSSHLGIGANIAPEFALPSVTCCFCASREFRLFPC